MSRLDWAFSAVTLRSPADGSGEVTHGLELYLDDVGITQRGGEPPQALQLPWAELHGLRCMPARRGRGPEILAVLGPVAMAFEVPAGQLGDAEVAELDAQLRAGFAEAIAAEGVEAPRRGIVPERFAKVPALLMAVVLAIAAVSVGIGITGGGQGSTPATTSPAQAPVLLEAGDLGAGWRVGRSTSSFVGSLIAPDDGRSTKAQRAQTEAVAKAYRSCMGVGQAEDRIFNPANPKPSAEARSSVLVRASSHGPIEAGNVYQRYARASEVAKDLAQVEDPDFPRCFGEAVGQLLAEGFASAGTLGVTYRAQAVALQPSLGVRGGGTEVVLAVPGDAGTVAVHLVVAVLGHGDREVTAYLSSAVTPFPAAALGAAVVALSAGLAGEAGGARTV